MIKDVIFLGSKSYTDFHIILKEEPVVNPPVTKTSFQPIPFGNGSLDLTEVLSNEPTYDDRDINLEFNLGGNKEVSREYYQIIKNAWHGRRGKLEIDTKPGYYFIGRMEIGVENFSGNVMTFSAVVRCEPYMLKKEITSLNVVIPPNENTLVEVMNSRMTTLPTITNSTEIIILFGSSSISLSPGTHTISEIVFKEGLNTLSISAVEGADLIISFQEGEL